MMASETLEDKKQEEIANVEDKGEVKEEGKTEEGEEEKEAEKKEEDTEMAEKEEEDEEKEEPEVKGEESKEEAEEVSKKAKRGRKGSSKKAAKDEKAAKSEPGSKEPVTPIERPIRERKTAERYSEPSTGRSASKALSIEKGQGTQLKDIPNAGRKELEKGGGVGFACLPLGLIFSFFRRPKAVITRSQYIKGEEKTNVAPNGELETEAKVVNIPSSCSMEFDAQTMNDLPEVEVIPPEEVSAVACDDKPDRLEMAQLYNEMCKVLGQNANESMEAFLANKPAGFKLKKNLFPLETIYQDINRILSPVQQDSSSIEPQIQKADSHSEMPTEIAGPNLLSTLQGDEPKSGLEATTVKSGPETECSNRSTTGPDFEKGKSNSPACEVVPAAADSFPPQTEPICSTNGTGDDVEMKELCDADSSADEPTEESADKSDPGVIVLNADVVDEDEDESQTTLALVCGNSATNKRTNLSLLYSFGHEDASIVAEIDVNAPLCSSIPNEVIQHGACLALGFPKESGDSRSGLHLSTPKRMVVSPLKKHKIKKLARRRKIKRWSTLEEDTLRTGVQKFGRGNWKLILNSDRYIFEERIEVDLKDKWRNMIHY
ncbi:unnamed protein product [Camellia sinensis]